MPQEVDFSSHVGRPPRISRFWLGWVAGSHKPLIVMEARDPACASTEVLGTGNEVSKRPVDMRGRRGR